MPEVATYSIGAVARMVRVPPATLRTWEERYGIVQPVRSDGGHRLYSRLDVERLRFVADRVREGISPGDAHRMLSGVSGNLPLPAADTGTQILIPAERDHYAAEFEFFLKTEGFEVVLALDAADAVGALAQERPQLGSSTCSSPVAPGSSCVETSMPAASPSWRCRASGRVTRRWRPARPRSCRSRSSPPARLRGRTSRERARS